MDIVLVGPGSVLGEAPAERLVAAARPAAGSRRKGPARLSLPPEGKRRTESIVAFSGGILT